MKIPDLKPGDRVAIIAPASKVQPEDIKKGCDILESWGLEVKVYPTVGSNFYNFSDTWSNRFFELQKVLDDPAVKCIMAARGGYGVSDLIDKLNFDRFKASPKWIIGFSDLTALLLHVNSLGFEAIHGPMGKTLDWDQQSAKYLKHILWGETANYKWEFDAANRIGRGTGMAVGGNLCMLAHSIGSSSDRSFEGKILFLEDVGEKLYAVDRMLVQLKRAGKLENLEGLVIGNFSDAVKEDVPFGYKIEEIVHNHTVNSKYPIAFGFPFGHEKINYPIVMGRNYRLVVDEKNSSLISYGDQGV